MSGRRVLITGVSNFLGASLARELAADGGVEYVAGVAMEEPPAGPKGLGGAEFIRADVRNPLIQRVLTSARVDTVVHTYLSSNPVRVGGRAQQKEMNVIGTMQLLGACQRIEAVQKVVMRSSTAVYGHEPADPSVYTESWSTNAHFEHGYSKDVADAETYARDFARRRPGVIVTILRMANLVGPTADTNMTQLFSLPLVPTSLGFDPRLQLVHELDAVEVLKRSVFEDHPGVYNVAGDGVIYLSQAIRLARRLPFPVIAPLVTAVADLLRAAGVVDFPTDQIGLLVHGRVVDNSRLKEVFGYEPKFTTAEAFRDFITARSAAIGPRVIGDLEKDLYSWMSKGGSRAPGAFARPHAVGGQAK